MEEITLTQSKRYHLWSLVALVGLFVLFIVLQYGFLSSTRHANQLFSLFRWPIIGACLFGGVVALRSIVSSAPGLTLSREGITVWRWPYKPMRAQWKDIDRIQYMSEVDYRSPLGIRSPVMKILMPNSVTIYVRDAAKSQNWAISMNRGNGLGDLIISGGMLGMQKEEIVTLIEKYWHTAVPPTQVSNYPRTSTDGRW
ncbi:MAG: hypothetical protein JST12_12045 [Armatimonadetes bacterium]|nr:hypothetical protein [Armatimonadota bacterium]